MGFCERCDGAGGHDEGCQFYRAKGGSMNDWQDRQQQKEDKLRKSLEKFSDDELEWELAQRENVKVEAEIEALRKKRKIVKSPY